MDLSTIIEALGLIEILLDKGKIERAEDRVKSLKVFLQARRAYSPNGTDLQHVRHEVLNASVVIKDLARDIIEQLRTMETGMNDPGPAGELTEMIKRHEGLRLLPYHDTVGTLSIGYGRNLMAVGISEQEAEILLHNDIRKAERDLLGFFPDAVELSTSRYNALVDMMFNLGLERLRTFTRMMQALSQEDFERTAEEMLDSKWARQVGARAMDLADMMRTG